MMAKGTQHATAQQMPTKLIATIACMIGCYFWISIPSDGPYLPDSGDEESRKGDEREEQ